MCIDKRLDFVLGDILQVEVLVLLKECPNIVDQQLQLRFTHDLYCLIEAGTVSQFLRWNDEDGLELRLPIMIFEPSA